jgi:hypothetical protein
MLDGCIYCGCVLTSSVCANPHCPSRNSYHTAASNLSFPAPLILDQMSQAQAEIERLRKALEWYADPQNWEGRAAGYEWAEGPAADDKGRRAREALAIRL